ncbi:MAG: DUF3553 domain-containing protein [Syntrophobacteraceae bacterium]
MGEIKLGLSKGDWVCHPRMPGWGYGQVLELIGADKGRIFFLLAGEKKLSWEHAGLVRVESDKASQTALSAQLVEFKFNIAIDLLASVSTDATATCVPSDSLSSICDLCECSSESVKRYTAQNSKMCICDACKDKIMLKNGDRESIIESIAAAEKRGRKETIKNKIQKTGKKRK